MTNSIRVLVCTLALSFCQCWESGYIAADDFQDVARPYYVIGETADTFYLHIPDTVTPSITVDDTVVDSCGDASLTYYVLYRYTYVFPPEVIGSWEASMGFYLQGSSAFPPVHRVEYTTTDSSITLIVGIYSLTDRESADTYWRVGPIVFRVVLTLEPSLYEEVGLIQWWSRF